MSLDDINRPWAQEGFCVIGICQTALRLGFSCQSESVDWRAVCTGQGTHTSSVLIQAGLLWKLGTLQTRWGWPLDTFPSVCTVPRHAQRRWDMFSPKTRCWCASPECRDVCKFMIGVRVYFRCSGSFSALPSLACSRLETMLEPCDACDQGHTVLGPQSRPYATDSRYSIVLGQKGTVPQARTPLNALLAGYALQLCGPRVAFRVKYAPQHMPITRTGLFASQTASIDIAFRKPPGLLDQIEGSLGTTDY